jgi:hypothetical protein
MLDVHVEKIGELAVVECEGRVVRSEAAFKLREAVTSLRNARIIVLELSEVRAMEGGGRCHRTARKYDEKGRRNKCRCVFSNDAPFLV